MDCSLLGSSVHGIFKARVLEWDAIAFSINTYYDIDIIIVVVVSKLGKHPVLLCD